MRKMAIVVSVVALFSTALSAEYILGVEALNDTAVMMVCIEDKVYADLGDALIKTIWEIDGELEHLNCKDYKIWSEL